MTRYLLAIAVAVLVAACALGQSSSERAFVNGGSRSALVQQDTDAIMQGVARAQYDSDRVARDTTGGALTH